MSDTRTHNIDTATDDVINQMICNLEGIDSLQHLAGLRLANKRFANLVDNNIYWKTNVSTHFRAVYKKNQHAKDINWLKLYKEEYNKQYGHFTNQKIKKVASAICHGKLADIHSLNPDLNDLISEVEDGNCTPVVLLTKNRKILRNLYETVIRPAYKAARWNTQRVDSLNKNRSILFWAIACQADIHEIKSLIEYERATTNETYFDTNETPLHIAAKYGRIDVIELLIETYGLRLDMPNKTGETALHTAAKHGKLGVIRYLADKEVNLNHVATNTALSLAASHGHNKAVTLLLEKGASTSVRDPGEIGSLPSHYAAYKNQLACLKRLVSHDRSLLDATDNFGATPLHFVARNGSNDMVAYLLAEGAAVDIVTNTNAKNNAHKTAIMLAASNSKWDTVLLLLNAGANLPALVNYLFLDDNSTALNELTKLKPEIFDQTYKDTLLQKAVTENKPKLTAYLLTAHANTSLKNSDGYSPILLAAMLGHHNCVKTITEHDITQIDTSYQNAASPVNGKTALFFAQESGDIASVDYLLAKMNDKQLFNALIFALQQKTFPLVQKIIELKPTLLSHRDAQNKTPLMIANDLNYKDAIDFCFKNNVFEEADPAVFVDIESHNEMNDKIIELNKTLKSNFVQDIELMIDTQNVLQILNSATTAPEVKLMAIDTYHATHHTISSAKYALCIAAIIAITLGVMLACIIGGAIIGALATSWSGPGAGLGALWGAVSGLPYGWATGTTIGACVVGLGAHSLVLTTNNFFNRLLEKKEARDTIEEMTDCAKGDINTKFNMFS